MMNKTRLCNLAAFLITAALLFSQPVAAQGGMVVDKIIAKIDNQIILKSDLEMAYQQQIAEGAPPSQEMKCQLLQQLIVNKMLIAKAEIDTIEVDDATVNREMNRRMEYLAMQSGGEEKLAKMLGKPLAQLKEELRPQIVEQMTMQKMQGELTQNVKVTPRQVKKFFNSIHKDSIPFLPKEVEVGQIVKYPMVNKEEKERVRQELLSLKKRILAGESFEELARRTSEDLGSRANGGDLGWQGRGDLVAEFEATALSLEPGQIADPVESEFGFHLIQLIERRGNQYRSRHILVRPQANDADLKMAEKFLDSIRTLIETKAISFEKAARDFSDDKNTKLKDGYFSSPETGEVRMPTDQLEYMVFMTVDTMKVGTTTKPMQFRVEEGEKVKPAVRILYFKDMVKPHFANLKDDYQKIYAATLAEEKNKVLQEWFEKTKKELFIDIDTEYQNCGIMDAF